MNQMQNKNMKINLELL